MKIMFLCMLVGTIVMLSATGPASFPGHPKN